MSTLLRKLKFYSISSNVSFSSDDSREIKEYKELFKYLYKNNNLYLKRSFINFNIQDNSSSVFKYEEETGILEYNIYSDSLNQLSYKYGNSIEQVGYILKYMFEDYYQVKIKKIGVLDVQHQYYTKN